MDLKLSRYGNKTICAAVSGGVDSTALLYCLKENAEKYGYRLCAVNFEHGIRGEESRLDSAFVEDLCKEWGIPLYRFSEDCISRSKRDKQSLETVARNFRNSIYDRLLREGKADVIATAHHANDQAETVLFRICRGTSTSGATGIKREENGRIRPFLTMTKAEILRYAVNKKLPFREDSTNFQTEATRNFIRLQVLPILEERIPAAVKNITRFAEIAEEDDRFLRELSNELVFRSKEGAGVRFFDKKPLFFRACLAAMRETGLDRDYERKHLEDLFLLQSSITGAKIDLPQGTRAIRRDDGIVFFKGTNIENSRYGSIAVKKGEFSLGRYRITLSNEAPELDGFDGKILRLDYEKLPKNCVIRAREPGDEFEKFGGGRKSLKRYMIDKKIPKEDRDVPIIAEGNIVYAIFGTEISEKIKIDDRTTDTVYLTIKTTGEEGNGSNYK